jgi:polyribonucleotide nucleotidyltransferase
MARSTSRSGVRGSLRDTKADNSLTETTDGPVISAVETVIDNGKFGKRTVKFETGFLARQAAGSVTA